VQGERTIRMHYANCATFNADFDGDEINLHLPQVCCLEVYIYHFSPNNSHHFVLYLCWSVSSAPSPGRLGHCRTKWDVQRAMALCMRTSNTLCQPTASPSEASSRCPPLLQSLPFAPAQKGAYMLLLVLLVSLAFASDSCRAALQ
jgi:RNA polymerase Rpb1, domain 2